MSRSGKFTCWCAGIAAAIFILSALLEPSATSVGAAIAIAGLALTVISSQGTIALLEKQLSEQRYYD